MRRVLPLVAVALILVLGFVTGYWIHGPGGSDTPPQQVEVPRGSAKDGILQPSVPAEQQAKIDAEAALPEEQRIELARGWCCMPGASVCDQREEAGACLNNGGRLFDRSQERCDKACEFFSTR